MTERRTEQIGPRFTPSELVRIERAAQQVGQTPAEFARASVLDHLESPPLTAEERAAFRRMIGAVKASVPVAPAWEMT